MKEPTASRPESSKTSTAVASWVRRRTSSRPISFHSESSIGRCGHHPELERGGEVLPHGAAWPSSRRGAREILRPHRQSLFYFDGKRELRHKILAIAEEQGAEKATMR